MTIETKKVASVNEAINIINRLNYTNETFHYKNSTFSDDYKVEYRFCDGVRDNDLYSGMSIIEIVVDGTLQTVRFFNHFCDIAVDLRIGDFMPDYDRFDNVIDADAVDTENANVENLTPNQKLAAQIVARLGNLIVKCESGEYGTRKGQIIFYETYADENDEFGAGISIVEVFTDDTSFILDHVNLIKGYGDNQTIEKFYFAQNDETPQPTMTIIKTADDTVKFFDGKFHSVFSKKYHAAIVQAPNGVVSYCIFSDGDTEVYNVAEHEVRYDKFFEVLTERGAFLSTVKFEVGQVYRLNAYVRKCNLKAIKRGSTYLTFKELNDCGQVTGAEERYKIKSNGGSEFVEVNTISRLTATLYATNLVADFAPVVAETPTVTNEAQDAAIDAEIEIANNSAGENVNAGDKNDKVLDLPAASTETLLQKYERLNNEYSRIQDEIMVGDNALRLKQVTARMVKIFFEDSDNYRDNDEYRQLESEYRTLSDYIAEQERLLDAKAQEISEFLTTPKAETQLATVNAESASEETAPVVIETVDTQVANSTETTSEESTPVDDFGAKLAELQANVDAAKADYDAKTAELDRLQAAVEDAKAEESIAWSKYFRLKDALSEFVRAKAKELNNTLIDDTILKAGKCQFVTTDGSRVEEFCSQIAITFFNGKFRIAGWQNKLAHYDTPAQVTAAINLLKAAIERGDKEFKFPTINELNNPPPEPKSDFKAKFLWDKIQRESKPLDDDNVWDLLPKVDELNDVQTDEPPAPYKPQCTWEDPHTIVMKTALLRCQIACQVLDIPAALNELKLFAICRDAHKVEPEEEFTPTPKRDRQKHDAASYEQIEAKAIKYDDTVKDLDKQIKTVEDECAFNQVCYDEPDDSRERIHFDVELKKLIDKGLKLVKKRDTLKIHRDRLYLTIDKLDAQVI